MASIKDITDLIKKNNAELISGIRKEISVIGCNLSAEFAELSAKLNGEVSTLKIDLTELQNKFLKLHEDFSYYDRRNDVLISNVPVQKDEIVGDLIQNIFVAIGCKFSSFQFHAYRLRQSVSLKHSEVNLRSTRSTSKKKVATDSAISGVGVVSLPPIILLKFLSSWDKSSFLNLYFKKKTLNLNDIGFESSMRIYISENLSPSTYSIFREAVQLKKAGLIGKIKTLNGCVFVADSTGKSTLVENLTHLKMLANVIIVNAVSQ